MTASALGYSWARMGLFGPGLIIVRSDELV